MKERPILFTGDMVRAILDGRKTVTRRVVKPQPNAGPHGEVVNLGGGSWGLLDGCLSGEWRCPYSVPGDLLWVRETWRPCSWDEGEPIRLEYKAGGPRHDCDDAWESEDWEDRIWESLDREFTAKGIEPDEHGVYRWKGESPLRWRPAIHLPKFGARLTLRVTDVRVERVQAIATEDVWAEGVQIPVGESSGSVCWRMAPANAAGKVPASYLPSGRLHPTSPPVTTDEVARAHFADLWDSINAKRGYPWADNPWVWRVAFEVVP